MKRPLRLFALFSFALFFFLGLQSGVKACNLSDVSLISIVAGPGSNYTINFRLCLGYGLTGSTKGADGATNGFTFGWYTSQVTPIFSIVSYTPTAVSSPAPNNCTMQGQNIPGPGGSAFTGVDIGTFYLFPGCTNRFLCVNSTVNCGNVGQLCFNFSFEVNYVPDSMRVFGAEGAGSAIAGCYPNSDMRIDFTGITGVIWGEVAAKAQGKTVEVNWSTVQELNADLFFLERLNAQGEFEVIATIPAVGNSTIHQNYQYTDISPVVGINHYRVVQVSKDATSTESESAITHFQGGDEYGWGAVGPNPSSSSLRVNFLSPVLESNLRLQLVDVSGKVLLEKTVNAAIGNNVIDLDLTTIHAGIYFVRLKAKESTLHYKISKV